METEKQHTCVTCGHSWVGGVFHPCENIQKEKLIMETKLYVEFKTNINNSEEHALDDEDVTFFQFDGHKATDIPSSVFMAAPDLLAVLKTLWDEGTLGENESLYLSLVKAGAKEAIARAKGRGE